MKSEDEIHKLSYMLITQAVAGDENALSEILNIYESYDFETGQFKEGSPQELIEKVKAEDEERRLAYEQALRDGFIL